MASSTSTLIFILLITISSPLIHARDSQFFNKVTNTPTQTETVVLPDKEQEQQPEFVPQNQNGHGLYGQDNTDNESGVQTQTPGTYASEKYYNYNNDKNRGETEETQQFGNQNGETFYANNGEKYQNGETFYTNNGEKYQNDDASFDFEDTKDRNDDAFYNNNINGVGTEHYDAYSTQKDNGEKYYSNKDQNDDASYYNNNYNGVGTEHYTTESQKDNLGETETYYSNTDKNDRFGNQLKQTQTSYNGNGLTNELNTRYNTIKPQNRGVSNVERQGMSDTRFMENGKYYYDVNMEEKNQYANQNTYKYNYNPKSNYESQIGNKEYQNNEVDANHYSNNMVYDNSGGEKYEFNTMEEYEQSRQKQYDP